MVHLHLLLSNNSGPTGAITLPANFNIIRCYDSQTGGREIRAIATNPSQGAQAHVMVATNQQPNTITTLTDTQHLFTFDDTWLDRGVFHLPGQWVVDSRLTPLQSRVQQHVDGRGLFFRSQHYDRLGRGTNTSEPNTPGIFEDIAELNIPTYRKYSWLQQAGNFESELNRLSDLGNSWGREITISRPLFNASDAAVSKL